MPCHKQENFPEYCDLLGEIHGIIENSSCTDCIVLGDYNADPTSIFGRELSSFCSEYGYEYLDRNLLPNDAYTFVSDAHGTVSWLDHCLVTSTIAKCIKNINIDYSVAWTDHRPLSITLSISGLSKSTLCDTDTKPFNPYAWTPKTNIQIGHYSELVKQCLPLDAYLLPIQSPNDIDIYHNNVITSMQASAKKAFHSKKANRKNHCIAGWNKHVDEQYTVSRDALLRWHYAGQPKEGPIAEHRKKSRAIFKTSLKQCQQNAEQHYMDSLASNLRENNFKIFWQKTNCVYKSKTSRPSHIDGETDTKKIANLLMSKFTQPPPACALIPTPALQVIPLRCSQRPTLPNTKPTSQVPETPSNESPATATFVTTELVYKIVRSMKRGKSPGCNGLSIEHVQYLGKPICDILTNLNAMIATGHLPTALTKTVIVPICKNKLKDVACSSNYKPIALAPIIARIFEKTIHALTEKCLGSCDHQMGFKNNSSTATAIYVVKQVASYYKAYGTSTIACYLDLSKAFDRVSHPILWEKLRARGVPAPILQTLKQWHEQQENTVRWNGVYSDPEKLQCGVRQGGSSSPVLFNLYMDQLSRDLEQSGVGCYMNGKCVNHVAYADDMLLLAPSTAAMRQLLSICEKYATAHNMLYNASKSAYMIFKSANTPAAIPPLYLDGQTLERTYTFKYLGHLIRDDLRDEDDLERQRRATCVKGNMLARRFSRCSPPVKRALFTTFCTNIYTAELWCNYTKAAFSEIRVQYNNAWRALNKLPRWCSAVRRRCLRRRGCPAGPPCCAA
ncbi:hypothetical protein O0L34_g12973 [Tuta absoluta]|nr:hypothetical protein O0L34_g12973 [Tuta absoluta]